MGRSERARKAALLDHDDDQDAELWIVSYADMVTLLFGFFVILYSFSTLDESKFDEMSKELSAAFSAKKSRIDPQDSASLDDKDRQLRAFQMLVSMMNLGEDATEAVAKIEQAAADASDKEAAKQFATDRLKIRRDHENDTIQVNINEESLLELILPDTTLFPAGGSTISEEARSKLKGLASDIRVMKDLADVEVVGHTDGEIPAAGSPNLNNFALSALRAGVVAQVLIDFGLDPAMVSTRGMGSLRPLVPETDAKGRIIPENRGKNRRVHIMLKTKRRNERAK